MAVVDPRILNAMKPPQPFVLRIHAFKPEDFEPNGDRYVVEVIQFDETIELGSLLVVTTPVPQKDQRGNPIPDSHPQADPTIERRGVIGAVIIEAGNGHLLGLPDWPDDDPTSLDASRAPANVPMFFSPGDVVLIDYNARGRALKMVGREIRIIGQIDVLARIKGVRLHRVNNEWVEEA